jgi:tricorn protease
MEGLMQRFEQISPDFGSAESPVVFQKEDKTSVLFVSNHEGGNGALYKTTIAPFAKNKTEKVEGLLYLIMKLPWLMANTLHWLEEYL